MISLVTATYNSDRYIKEYKKRLLIFASELEQNQVKFEVLIRCTNPSPVEKAVFDELSKYSWCNIAEVSRRGAYAAWNEGVISATGDVVGFWNADDIRFPKAVVEAEQLVMSGADVVYFPFIIKRYFNILGFSIKVYTKRVQGPDLDFDVKKFSRGMVCGPHFMFKRSLFHEIGPFDEQFKFASDFDWCVRAVEYTQKFVQGKELSGIFRVDGTGLSSGNKPWRAAENNTIMIRHGQNDLVVETTPEEQAKYHQDQFLFRGQWYDLAKLNSVV